MRRGVLQSAALSAAIGGIGVAGVFSLTRVAPVPVKPAKSVKVALPESSQPEWVSSLERGEEGPAGSYLDVALSRFDSLEHLGRAGIYPDGESAFASRTTACNVGTELVPWLSAMDPRHPMILQNLYRISDGRLEQIGVSWAKHGFYALDMGGCGVLDCQGNTDDSALDLGCQDTYDARTNADRAWLGPRSEINGLTAGWDPCGSLFDIGDGSNPDCRRSYYGGGASPTDHRMKVKDADLLVPGATFISEGCYVVADDDEPLNNVAYHEVSFEWTGQAWHPTEIDRVYYWPVVMQWGDTQNFASPRDDGTAIVAARTVDLGNGSHRYEYAVYNHNIQRKISSFSVPVADDVTVTNMGFHAPVDEEEIYDMAPWNHEVVGTGSNRAVTWWTEDIDENPLANTLRYSTTYTFWFEATSAPELTTVEMDLFEAGAFPSLTCATLGPRGGVASSLRLEASEVHRGQTAELTVTGARPNERVYFLYSLSPFPAGSQRGGLGRTFAPALGLDVDLTFPIVRAATVRADGSGQAIFSTPVYEALPLSDVALQAVVQRSGEPSLKSNAVLRRVLD